MTSRRYKWTRDEIARRTPLPALLQSEGFGLRETGGSNFEVMKHPGLIIKDNFWRWPREDLQGNTIDLFVDVLGMSFDQAMQRITQHG